MKRDRWWAIFLVVAVFLLPSVAIAASYGGVGGRPANPQPSNPRTQSIFIYELKPGQSAADGVRVINNTNQRQKVYLYGVDSILSSGGAFACAQNADPKIDVGAWIHLSSSSVSLAPNTNQVVPFTVAVPGSKTISVGEHDGCIALQAASETATASNHNGVELSFRSAIRLVVTIPGKIVKRLDIKTVTVSRAKDGNYLVTPVILNSGNVSLDTSLQVKLLPLIGASTAPSKPDVSPILPRTKASPNLEVKRPFWGGFYRAQITALYNNNPATQLGLGSRVNQQEVSKNSALFFAMPTIAAACIELFILLIVASAVVWVIRWRQRAKRIQRHWQIYNVKSGDSIEKLAKKFDTSWKQIATVNKLKAPYSLKRGQKIKLPSKPKKKS